MSTRVEAAYWGAIAVNRDDEFASRVAQSERRVFQIAYGVLGNAAEAEDVAQEAFLRAFRRLARLREPDKFRAWVCRITFHLALNQRRRRLRQLARDAAWHSSNPISRPDGADHANDRIFLDHLRQEIERLPEKMRAVLLLSAVEGMEASEVAALLEIPAGTVRSRLHLARKRLLEVMNR